MYIFDKDHMILTLSHRFGKEVVLFVEFELNMPGTNVPQFSHIHSTWVEIESLMLSKTSFQYNKAISTNFTSSQKDHLGCESDLLKVLLRTIIPF